MPEMVPVAVSKVSPTGSVPVSAYVALLPISANKDVVTGVIAALTAPVVVAADGAIAGLVIKVDVVTEEPVPAAFTAEIADVY
jgi:hypothetical protein